jgi:hypothetical protein
MEGCELTDQGKTVMLLAEYDMGVEVMSSMVSLSPCSSALLHVTT